MSRRDTNQYSPRSVLCSTSPATVRQEFQTIRAAEQHAKAPVTRADCSLREAVRQARADPKAVTSREVRSVLIRNTQERRMLVRCYCSLFAWVAVPFQAVPPALRSRSAFAITRSDTPMSAAIAAHNEAWPANVKITNTALTPRETVTFWRIIPRVRRE